VAERQAVSRKICRNPGETQWQRTQEAGSAGVQQKTVVRNLETAGEEPRGRQENAGRKQQKPRREKSERAGAETRQEAGERNRLQDPAGTVDEREQETKTQSSEQQVSRKMVSAETQVASSRSRNAENAVSR